MIIPFAFIEVEKGRTKENAAHSTDLIEFDFDFALNSGVRHT